MTPSTEPRPSEPADATPAVPLDEVMLAMDVVDTLRHEREMLEASLDGDRRERGLIERIKAIYASQGIDVPDEIIAQGVEALEQDRFTYDPPERTLSVRLAEIYVDRAKWTKRTAIVAVAVVVVWLAITVPMHLLDRARIDDFKGRLASLGRTAEDLDGQVDGLRAELKTVRAGGVSSGAADILEGASLELSEISAGLRRVRGELAPGPDPDRYLEQREELDRELEKDRDLLASLASGLGGVRGQLDAVSRLATLGTSVQRVMARLDGLEVDPEVRRELARLRGRVDESLAAGDVGGARDRLRQLEQRVDGLVRAHELRLATKSGLASQLARVAGMEIEAAARRELESLRTGVEAALDAGDVDAAQSDLARLTGLVDVLDQSYELRIVSRPGDRSGVWRRDNSRPGVRNYYVIVEAVSDGEVLRLPITNEENGETSRVRRFGVRVPEAVYERVKADKLDNGLIDDAVVGVKKRGAREVEYRFEVAGGMITRW